MSSIEAFPIKRGTARFSEECIHFDESFPGHAQALYQEYWQSGTWWYNGIFVGYILSRSHRVRVSVR